MRVFLDECVDWRLSGDLLAWSALVGEGVREGWLPWKESDPG